MSASLVERAEIGWKALAAELRGLTEDAVDVAANGFVELLRRRPEGLDADLVRAVADFWAAVATVVGSAPTEEARLRRLLLGEEPIMHDFRRTADGGATARVQHWAVRLLVDSFIESFGNPPNYAEMQFHHFTTGPFVVTMQKVGRLTPHRARALAEAEVRRLLALLHENGIEASTTLEMALEPAAPAQLRGREFDWIVLDVERSPNVLVCERCGRELTLPTPAPANILMSLERTFQDAHKVCQEGDAAVRGARTTPR